MPQASQRLRDMFPDIGYAECVLLEAGWACKDFYWTPPAGAPSEHELDALDYMIEEWDYGYKPREI